MPVMVLVQFGPVMLGSVPPHTPAKRALMIAGLAKPIATCQAAGPYSWKKLGSLILVKESWAFWPSSVLVWSHSSPLAIRSAPGVAITPHLPGIRLATTAWPASGDGVPFASYSGQVTIIPVIPVAVTSPATMLVDPACVPISGFPEIGQASTPVVGSSV